MGYCEWADTDRLHKVYHDTEWGIPVHDDRRMFEHLALECMQCGLSWGLMLKKREIFRTCFHHFDYDRIAGYDEKDVERILNTEGMIRSVRKVNAMIHNARCYQKVREEFGTFCDYLWAYSDGKTILYQGHDTGRIPVSNGLSDRISKDDVIDVDYLNGVIHNLTTGEDYACSRIPPHIEAIVEQGGLIPYITHVKLHR